MRRRSATLGDDSPERVQTEGVRPFWDKPGWSQAAPECAERSPLKSTCSPLCSTSLADVSAASAAASALARVGLPLRRARSVLGRLDVELGVLLFRLRGVGLAGHVHGLAADGGAHRRTLCALLGGGFFVHRFHLGLALLGG